MDEPSIDDIMLRYSQSRFGPSGEDLELSVNKEAFERFQQKATTIRWASMEDQIREAIPAIGFGLFETAYNVLKAGNIKTKMKKGHEAHEEFEKQAEQSLVNLILEALPGINLVTEFEHGDEPRYYTRAKNKPNIRLSYDVVDGNTNFLNAIIPIVEDRGVFTGDLYDRFTIPAGICLQFSLEEYPNYPFVTVYYSFMTKRVISFSRSRYGDNGRALIGYGRVGDSSIKPREFRVGTPKAIIPNYVGQRYDLHGIFKEALRDYYASFDKKIDPDGATRSTAADLETMGDNQAQMYIDVRKLLPRLDSDEVATLQLADTTAICPPLSAAGWPILHTDGTGWMS